MLLLVAATLGALATPASAAECDGRPCPGATADDVDADGVPNSVDKCDRFEMPGVVQADGCPPFAARIALFDDAAGGLVRTSGARVEPVSFTATLTLDAASAKRLKLKRRIGRMAASVEGQPDRYGTRTTNFSFGFTSAVKKALKDAGRIKMTLAGTYERVGEGPKAFTPRTFGGNGKNVILDTSKGDGLSDE